MKPSRIFSLSLLSAGLVLSLASARADDPANPPVPPPAPANPDTTPAEGQPPHHRRMHGAFVLGDLTAKLTLTSEQQKSVGGFIKDCDGQLKELRGDDSLSKEDKHAKMKSIIDATRSQIRGVLTPDQQAIFDTLPTRGGHRQDQNAAPTSAPTSPPTT
jgi:hypothetical protein